MRQRRFQQQDIHPARGKSDTGIQLFLEHQRNAVAEHIAQHSAEYASDHGGDGSNDGGVPAIQCNLGANNREHH